MKLNRYFCLAIALICFGFTINTQAQRYDCQHSKSNFKSTKDLNFEIDTRSDSIDITHIDIDLKLLSFTTKVLDGFSIVHFKPKVDSISKITLDLAALTVDSVKNNDGEQVTFSQLGYKLKIVLSAAFNTNEETTVTVFYKGVPTSDPNGFGGFLFSGNNYAYNLGVGLSVKPHNFGRAWFPCFDNFTERQSFTTTFRTLGDKKAVCGGMLTFDNVVDGLNVRTWNLIEEIPSYLASVAVANYAQVNKVFNSLLNPQLPVNFHALPSDTTNMKNSFANLNRLFDSLEVRFGPYRWERIGYVLVPFLGGAMEHATNIAYPLILTNGNTTYQQTMSHELAHSWFGNLATCRTASEMWLNEGFASYIEFLTTEWLSGSQSYINEIRNNHRSMLNFCHVRDDGYWALSAMPGTQTYGFTTYRKGADVIHSLRSYMGDEFFFDGLKQFLNQNQMTDVSAQDLFESLSISSGQDLTDFMNDWILQPGWAAFQVDSLATQPNGSEFQTTANFSQRIKGADHLYNQVPITITFFGNNFEQTNRSVTIAPNYSASFTLPFNPVFAVLNIDHKISQAATFDMPTIKTIGLLNLANGLLEVTTTAVTDSVLLHVEHFWVGKNTDMPLIDGEYMISPDRYWKIGGLRLNQLTASARFTFNGRTNSLSSGWLDNNFINSDTNVVLLYRSSSNQPWALHPNYQLNTLSSVNDKFGNINVPSLQAGEYALGLKLNTSSIGAVYQSKELKFFPNPSNGDIYLDGNAQFEQAQYQIFDEEGKLLLQGKVANNHINAQSLSNGFYLFSIEKGNQHRYGKLLIAK